MPPALIGGLPTPLDKQFAKAVVSYILVVTYESVVLGWLLRRFAAYTVRKDGHSNFTGGGDAQAMALSVARG